MHLNSKKKSRLRELVAKNYTHMYAMIVCIVRQADFKAAEWWWQRWRVLVFGLVKKINFIYFNKLYCCSGYMQACEAAPQFQQFLYSLSFPLSPSIRWLFFSLQQQNQLNFSIKDHRLCLTYDAMT